MAAGKRKQGGSKERQERNVCSVADAFHVANRIFGVGLFFPLFCAVHILWAYQRTNRPTDCLALALALTLVRDGIFVGDAQAALDT